MNNPKISIIVPTYGRAEYLKNLIASIRAFTPRDVYELVVISSDLPESEKVKWLSQQEDVNLILADARKKWQLRKKSSCYYVNLGIKKSKREWVFVISDDVCFCEGWYEEFVNLLSNPDDSNAGMIIILSHIGKVRHGRRIVKIGKTKKGDGDWKDLYLSDFSIIAKNVLEEIGLFDEKLDQFGCGADNSLAIEFLTNKNTVVSEKIRVDHFVADENRSVGNEFEDFNYIIRKWNKWCRVNNCQYIWDPKIKPYTLKNRLVNYLYQKARILRHYGRYIMGTYRQK